jgi:hypothetical protein
VTEELGLPDDCVSAHYELWLGVPLVVCNVVVCLEPDPLLTLGQKPIVAGFTLPKLHYCEDNTGTFSTEQSGIHKSLHCPCSQNPKTSGVASSKQSQKSGLFMNIGEVEIEM